MFCLPRETPLTLLEPLKAPGPRRKRRRAFCFRRVLPNADHIALSQAPTADRSHWRKPLHPTHAPRDIRSAQRPALQHDGQAHRNRPGPTPRTTGSRRTASPEGRTSISASDRAPGGRANDQYQRGARRPNPRSDHLPPYGKKTIGPMLERGRPRIRRPKTPPPNQHQRAITRPTMLH